MLLTKTVIVKWVGRTKKHYISKGYVYTKMGDKFEVKVEDLTDGSGELVDVKCDCKDCKDPYLPPMQWDAYRKLVHENGVYYCQKCSCKLFGAERRRISQLKDDNTFGYWLIKNLPLKQAIEIILRWDDELNGKDIREISYSSSGINKKGYWFKCPRDLHKSEIKNINSFTNNFKLYGFSNSLDCDMCESFAQWGYDNVDNDFLSKYWDYEKNIDKNENPIDPWKINKFTNNKVWLFCQEKSYHGSYLASCYGFTLGNRCSYCTTRNGKVHRFDSLGWLYPQVFDIWSDKNIKSPYEYSPMSQQYVWWMCLDGKHEDYYRKIGKSHEVDFRCSKCVTERDESFLQEKTRLHLEFLGYNVLHEQYCSLNPKNPVTPPSERRTTRLRYDNEITINNKHLFIEVMGNQHERISIWQKKSAKKYGTTPEQELEYQIAKDVYKEQYVYAQGENYYYYLAVWYYHFDKKDTYKRLIDDKIKEILNNNSSNIDTKVS